ncbi:hypothetical protein DLE54_00185 [Psychrobacter sp. YP14]|uniref:DUF262 domain-containing protein n=1 Tax=Psychrobacter sp. YP14 TaxID=2203895 RepID=UPI000D7DAB91|nr:DUF262 domain-containing protein [Psychrobacter sp. YP14]AWT48097.1 hypothetical protein DLE54_00185 [Psychrobacter sp. YP14]
MKANETKIQDFLSANKTRFVIPIYQRNYDWSTAQCKQLLDDILHIGTGYELAHFIGSVVYVHDDIYTSSKIKELSIIDGQQRLTTLTLIYLAIYHLAIEMEDENLKSEIYETYLVNKFVPESEKSKLRPTQDNLAALNYLLRADATEEFSKYSKITENFDYFKSRINEQNYETVLEGLSKLMVVEISLERQKDNPQRIFESLNSTGLELSQADLIRNYILMGLTRESQNRIYEDYWKLIENLARDENRNISKVSDFIRDYLTLISNKIPNKNKVYEEFKNKFPTSDIAELEDILSPIKSLAKFYNKLINPRNEADSDIRRQLEYIDQLEIKVAYPFLIKVYEDYANGIISKNDFLAILSFVQSYVWRRFVISLPTNALNKVFMTLYEKVDKDDYLESIQKHIAKRKGSHRMPQDSEVIEALKHKDVYNIKSKNRLYLFSRLENFNNNEVVTIEGNSDITVEHIFPQKPSHAWKSQLSDIEIREMKDEYLHTLGNLTLSGNNGSLGNKDFISKRDIPDKGYRDSRLWLNRYLSGIDVWNIKNLENRFNILAERCLKVWPYPDVDIEEYDESLEEVSIFEAEDPTHKKIDYAVLFGQKINLVNMADLYMKVLSYLFEQNPELFFNTDLVEKIELVKITNQDRLRQPKSINPTYVIETNLSNVNKFERIKYALEVFEAEDELTIKYADES